MHVSEPLLLPDPIREKGLISWHRAIARLMAQPAGVREAIYERFGRPLEADLIPTLILDRSRPFDRMALAAMGAAREGMLGVFVAEPHHAYVYEFMLAVWADSNGGVVNPLHLTVHGRFLPVTDLLPRNSPEAEVAGACLFVRSKELNRLLKPRGESEAALRATAMQIINDHQEVHSGTALPREDFVSRLQAAHPGASKRQVQRVRAATIPPEWRKPGRKG
jgi:hypothetical protein